MGGARIKGEGAVSLFKKNKKPSRINFCALHEIRSGTKRHSDVCDFVNVISEISIGASGSWKTERSGETHTQQR